MFYNKIYIIYITYIVVLGCVICNFILSLYFEHNGMSCTKKIVRNFTVSF